MLLQLPITREHYDALDRIKEVDHYQHMIICMLPGFRDVTCAYMCMFRFFVTRSMVDDNHNGTSCCLNDFHFVLTL